MNEKTIVVHFRNGQIKQKKGRGKQVKRYVYNTVSNSSHQLTLVGLTKHVKTEDVKDILPRNLNTSKKEIDVFSIGVAMCRPTTKFSHREKALVNRLRKFKIDLPISISRGDSYDKKEGELIATYRANENPSFILLNSDIRTFDDKLSYLVTLGENISQFPKTEIHKLKKIDNERFFSMFSIYPKDEEKRLKRKEIENEYAKFGVKKQHMDS